ncbi:MAG: hypothetical protein P8074_22185 [Anaerolineales bacterium]
MATYRRIAQLKSAQKFRAHLQALQIELPFDERLDGGAQAPLAQPYRLQDGRQIGNRFCALPMEGWDATPDGRPTELTLRRWRNFGSSGAKLIWGGEAVAVQPDGKANPNQLLINEENLEDLARLRRALVAAHAARYGNTDDLLVGLQLTHSGRFSHPKRRERLEPWILYHHPYLDEKLGIPPAYPVVSDDQIETLIARFIAAAGQAQAAGFDFVDIKHCHGYLGHELLSAYTRPGPFGGSFENRTRFLRAIVSGIREQVPGLRVGVRLSAFDTPPFAASPGDGAGKALLEQGAGHYWFGADRQNPLQFDLQESVRFLALLESLGVELVNLTAGSPYYNPHIQRPALFPPSDGYAPPEDPLVGVARQIQATAQLKRRFPNLLVVGSAYSYLQEWLPHVAQHNVRTGRVDFAGLGRMLLAYPEFPADVLAGRALDRKRICRTFSDCTTAPRHGLVSGCYPLDPAYKESPQAAMLSELKRS